MDKQRVILWWLLGCLLLITLMVVVGGLTRLTESGLSMTGWAPITGWFPPLTEGAWIEEFQRYQRSPQYRLMNHGMELAEFQGIFWLEYIHRVLGRITGLFCLLPLLWFTWKRYVSSGYLWCFWGMAIGIVLQGIIGWYMVRSGLQNLPYVSPLWLAFHLGAACLLLGFVAVVLLRLYYPKRTQPQRWVSSSFLVLGALVFLQILLGALVAGHDAGLIYNSFPTMDGMWIPGDIGYLSPWYRNFFFNVTTVQFQHRVIAYVVAFWVIGMYGVLWREKFLLTNGIKYAISLPFACVAVQFLLGVMTLLYHVPIWLASLHQLGAILLLLSVIWGWYRIGVKDV